MKKKILLLILFLLIGVQAYSQIPNPPTLISPTDSSIVQIINILLDWSDVPTANSYRVQVSTSPNFSTTILNVGGVISSQYTITSGILTHNTLYYWRVNATNINGTSQWSSVWRFITVSVPPPPPILLYPPNNAINISLTPTLDWTDVTGATSYKVHVSSVLDTIVVTSEVTIPPGRLNYSSMYFWRVAAISNGGQGPFTAIWSFTTIGSSGVRIISSEIPTEYKLYSNYPNPFNPTTKIKFDIAPLLRGVGEARGVFTSLKVYDILGKEVATLVNEQLAPGTYEATFDGTNFTSGIYFYRLETPEFVQTNKMILLK
jgi:hypothetical protein